MRAFRRRRAPARSRARTVAHRAPGRGCASRLSQAESRGPRLAQGTHFRCRLRPDSSVCLRVCVEPQWHRIDDNTAIARPSESQPLRMPRRAAQHPRTRKTQSADGQACYIRRTRIYGAPYIRVYTRIYSPPLPYTAIYGSVPLRVCCGDVSSSCSRACEALLTAARDADQAAAGCAAMQAARALPGQRAQRAGSARAYL